MRSETNFKAQDCLSRKDLQIYSRKLFEQHCSVAVFEKEIIFNVKNKNIQVYQKRNEIFKKIEQAKLFFGKIATNRNLFIINLNTLL